MQYSRVNVWMWLRQITYALRVFMLLSNSFTTMECSSTQLLLLSYYRVPQQVS